MIDPRQILAAVKAAPSPPGPPGMTQTYSNVGYLALGEVVATVTGPPSRRRSARASWTRFA